MAAARRPRQRATPGARSGGDTLSRAELDSTQAPAAPAQRAFRLFLSTALVATLAVVAEQRIVEVSRIVSGSMEPTLAVGDWLISTSIPMLNLPIARGDIVTFYPPRGRPSPIPLVKRVIGLPGESVAVRGGAVFIDGTRLDEPYLHGTSTPYSMVVAKVPEGTVLVLGDNRGRSEDSSVFGAVELRRLRHKVWLRIAPTSRHCSFAGPVLGFPPCT
ncbi:MAG: signal peptidase I [bacterium]